MYLNVVEFMRRFMLHVLPKGFTRIRHYGILAGRNKNASIGLCKELMLKQPDPNQIKQELVKKIETESWLEKVKRVTGHNPLLCPGCKNAQMIIIGGIGSSEYFVGKKLELESIQDYVKVITQERI